MRTASSLTLLVVLSTTGCAATYRPALPHVPLLEEEGDSHVSGHLGISGAQLQGAWALSDAFGLRAAGQAFAGQDEHLAHATVGGELFTAFRAPTGAELGERPHGPRASLALDVGPGASRGSTRVNTGSSTNDMVLSGSFLRAGLQGTIAYEWEFFALGLVARTSYLYFTHNEGSDEPAGDAAQMLMAEPSAFIRFGSGNVKLDIHYGLALPYWGEGNMGVPIPIFFGGGLVVDL